VSGVPLAARREPSKITPGPEGSWPLDYDELIQPVLNVYCVSCHQVGGGDSHKFNLTRGKSWETLLNYGKPSLRDAVKNRYLAGRSVAGEGAARQSQLLRYLGENPDHRAIVLDAESRDALVTWLDTYAQRLGHFSPEQEAHLAELRQSWAALLDK
jgi:hypothetical protein